MGQRIDYPREGPEVTRLADRSDNARLCELFAEVSMEADLHLTVERDPDFFALYDMQGPEQHVAVVLFDDRIEALGTVLGREGWLHGERVQLGYAGDLRLTPRVRGGYFLGHHYGPLFDHACEHLSCEVALTAVIRSNRRALKALVERHPKYPGKPWYTHLRDFDILSLHFTRRRRPRPTQLEIRSATRADLPQIAEHLGEDHRRRPFGYILDEAELQRRLSEWPGLRVEDFLLAFDPPARGGRLRGVLASWDAWPVKRYKVLGYHRQMRFVRAGFDVASKVLRFPSLPPPGGNFRYFYLTHVSIPDEDPAVMSALLDRVYAQKRSEGYHFLTACVYDDDPLAPAFGRYMTTALPAALFAVSKPGSPHNHLDIGRARPGFEMALV